MPPGQTEQESIQWKSALAVILVHLAAPLALFPRYFDWTWLTLTALAVPIFGIGINLSYHRQLAHRSFKTPKWLERALASFAMCNFQDSPIAWVATHRRHHQFTDTDKDPHSPRRSLFWSHCGWVMRWRRLEGAEAHAPDLWNDPFYQRLENGPWREGIYFGHLVLLFGIGVAWDLLEHGLTRDSLRVGMSAALWLGVVRTVCVWHITWSVNSLSHRFGYRNYDTHDDSRNNWLVGWLAVGEGWHNNHHADPACATTQRRWWEVDLVYLVIKAMAVAGLASDIQISRKTPIPKT